MVLNTFIWVFISSPCKFKIACSELFWQFALSSEQADVDGNGTLDYGEFVTVSIHLKKIGNDEHIRKAFLHFDQNQSGYIEIEELRAALADDLGSDQEEVIDAIIRDVDTDKVSSATFVQIFTLSLDILSRKMWEKKTSYSLVIHACSYSHTAGCIYSCVGWKSDWVDNHDAFASCILTVHFPF